MHGGTLYRCASRTTESHGESDSFQKVERKKKSEYSIVSNRKGAGPRAGLGYAIVLWA
jgi:hypothetical protein